MKHATQQEYIITISPLENAFISQYSSIYGTLATMTSHFLYAILQTHAHFCIKQVEACLKRKMTSFAKNITDQSETMKVLLKLPDQSEEI